AAEPEGDGLVEEPSALPPDPELNDDEVGPVERSIAVGSEHQFSRPFPPREHAARQAADDLQAVHVRVEPGELVHGQSVPVRDDSLDELRGVRTPPAHDGDLGSHAGGSYGKVRKPWNR